MVIFASKETFLNLGLEPITHSSAIVSQDCKICLEPINTTKTSSAVLPSKDYLPIRIRTCGHVHDKECLRAWLDIGNTCPTCKCELFQAHTDDPITQRDVSHVVRVLGPIFGADRVVLAIGRLVSKKECEVKKRSSLQSRHVKVIHQATTETPATCEDGSTSGDDIWYESDVDDDEEGGVPVDAEEEAGFSEHGDDGSFDHRN